jgi:hypothetical protein
MARTAEGLVVSILISDPLVNSNVSQALNVNPEKPRAHCNNASDFLAMIEQFTARNGSIKQLGAGKAGAAKTMQPSDEQATIQAGNQPLRQTGAYDAPSGLFHDKMREFSGTQRSLERRAWMEQNQIDDYSGNTWRKSLNTIKSEITAAYSYTTNGGLSEDPKLRQQFDDAMAWLDAHEKKVLSGQKLDMADGMRTGLIVGQDQDGMMKQVEWDVLREHQRGLRAAGREQTEAERFSDWIKLSVRRER